MAGQRTAVNLGGIDRASLARGEVLAHPHTLAPSSMIVSTIQLLPSLRRPIPARSKVLFHLGTHQQEATCLLLDRPRLEPGETGLAQLRFQIPVVGLPGDRFILRGFQKQENYGTTIGGGELVHVLARKVRARDKENILLLDRMRQVAAGDRLALELLVAGPTGLTRKALQQRLPWLPAELDRLLLKLVERGILIRYDKESGAVLHADHFRALRERLLALLDTFHRERPLEPGVSREELRSRLGMGVDSRLFFTLLLSLEKSVAIVVERELCRRPTHTLKAAGQSLRPLAEQIRALYESAQLAPPREADLPQTLGADPALVTNALKLLQEEGALVHVSALFFPRTALAALRDRLVQFLEREGQISAAQFKEMVGQSRKFSIPLAEYFDAQKVTLRVGDLRRLRR